jgi:hypothetical protein
MKLTAATTWAISLLPASLPAKGEIIFGQFKSGSFNKRSEALVARGYRSRP